MLDDDVSIDELRKAVEHLHGVPATYVESVEVDERFGAAVAWQGTVKVFSLSGHPSGATRAYAWSHRVETPKRLDGGEVRHGRRKFLAVLGLPPVDSALMAVRVHIMAESEKREN